MVAMDKIVGDRHAVGGRATWRRRTLADGLADEVGLFHERAGALVWLGRCRRWQSSLPTPACRQEIGRAHV